MWSKQGLLTNGILRLHPSTNVPRSGLRIKKAGDLRPPASHYVFKDPSFKNEVV
jgi:hypothetical protein